MDAAAIAAVGAKQIRRAAGLQGRNGGARAAANGDTGAGADGPQHGRGFLLPAVAKGDGDRGGLAGLQQSVGIGVTGNLQARYL